MKTICSYCGELMTDDLNPDLLVSHGACDDCAAIEHIRMDLTIRDRAVVKVNEHLGVGEWTEKCQKLLEILDSRPKRKPTTVYAVKVEAGYGDWTLDTLYWDRADAEAIVDEKNKTSDFDKRMLDIRGFSVRTRPVR